MRRFSVAVHLALLLVLMVIVSSCSGQASPGDNLRGASPHFTTLDRAGIAAILAEYQATGGATSVAQAVEFFHRDYYPYLEGYGGYPHLTPPLLPTNPAPTNASAADAIYTQPGVIWLDYNGQQMSTPLNSWNCAWGQGPNS